MLILNFINKQAVNIMKERLFAYLPFLLIGFLFFIGGFYLLVKRGFGLPSFTLLTIGMCICGAFYYVAKIDFEAEQARKREWAAYNKKYGGRR